MTEATATANPWLADNDASDWDDTLHSFWFGEIHGKEVLSRGRVDAWRGERTHTRWCDEHKDFEGPMRRITGEQALAWAHAKAHPPIS